jgi:steroid delta-isomerase-like uncharacterized protein
MTSEEITRLFARYRDAYARRDSVAFAASYAEDCVVESPAFGRLIGRAALDRVHRDWSRAFPDTQVEFGDLLITGNCVVQTATLHGTDTGGLLGQAPTGNHYRLFIVQLFDVGDDGQIVRERRVYDVNGVLLQLATGHDLADDGRHSYRAALATVRSEHELSVAAEIQHALLPAPHYKGMGFEVAFSSLSCRAIGGDFLDYYTFPSGAFGFVLGDVSGKGPAAALLAAKIQGILGTHSRSEYRPAELLARVNDELVRRTIESRFATVLYGVLWDGQLTYSSGGHNPALIVGSGGVRRLERGGLILGAFYDASFEEETVWLDPGDVLVVFSDGITEALSPDGSEFGEERLIAAIRAGRELPPTRLLQQVLDSVREFIGGADQSDDLTALVLRYTGL